MKKGIRQIVMNANTETAALIIDLLLDAYQAKFGSRQWWDLQEPELNEIFQLANDAGVSFYVVRKTDDLYYREGDSLPAKEAVRRAIVLNENDYSSYWTAKPVLVVKYLK